MANKRKVELPSQECEHPECKLRVTLWKHMPEGPVWCVGHGAEQFMPGFAQ